MKKLKIILLSKTFSIVFLFISLIYTFICIKFVKYSSKYSLEENNFNCIVTDFKIDGNKVTLTLNCKEKLIGTYYIKTLEEKNYILENIKYGSKLDIIGSLSIPSNNTIFNTFNYKEYLNNNRIYYLLNINSYIIDNSNISVIYNIKNYFYKRANKLNNSYVYSLILGNKSYIDEDALNSYKENGISHLLALSGLHVCFLSSLLLKILNKFKINGLLSIILVFAFLIILYLISGYSISFLRAILLFLLVNIKKIFNIEIKTINMLMIVFSMFLFVNPFMLFNIGFLYSFIITFFIIRFYNNKNNYIKDLLSISIISYISSLGLSIYYFGSTNLLSPLLNLIFVPIFSTIIFPLSIMTFIFSFLDIITKYITLLYESLSILVSKLSITIHFPKASLFFILLYYLIIYFLFKYRKKIYIILCLTLLVFNYYKYLLDNNSYLCYLDVGQGDSIVYVSPQYKSVIVIDTGGVTQYKTDSWKEQKKKNNIIINKTIPFLRSLGIKRINYLILSHGDYDHMGEAINLVENFKVEKVIFNCGEYNDLEKDLIKVLDKKKISYYSCIKELNIDDNKLYFLQTKEYDNENDNSNVIYIEIDGYKFMFMGDAGVEKEKDILDKYNISNIDVLKVGHHGSKTSSSKSFIDKLNPEYSIISVGKNNRYGHPNKEVYRTDQDGSIMFKIKNNKLKIETCSP